MTEIVPSESPREVARYFQESGLFPDLRSEAQAFVKIVAGREMGLGPLAAVSGLNVIKGRVTFSANLLASMVKRHPVYDYRVEDHTEETCRIAFYQSGEEIGTSEFTIEDARRAGLAGQNWQRYPKAMLFARALTQGVRWFCPDVTSGTPAYVSEELTETVGHPETVDPRVRGDLEVPPDVSEGEVVNGTVEPTADLKRLADLVEEYELTEEAREGLREFVRDGGDEAVETAINLLEKGNLSALFAGLEWEASR